MYATIPMARGLIINKKSETSDSQLEAVGNVIDPQIDARLGSAFYWPEDSSGATIDPVPTLISVAASYLVAATIESSAYAQNEAGKNEKNPYATSLEEQGWRIIEDLIAGLIHIPALERTEVVFSAAPTSSFRPVYGSGRP